MVSLPRPTAEDINDMTLSLLSVVAIAYTTTVAYAADPSCPGMKAQTRQAVDEVRKQLALVRYVAGGGSELVQIGGGEV